MLTLREQHASRQSMATWILVTDGERIRVIEMAEPNGSPQELDPTELLEVLPRDIAENDVFFIGDQASAGNGHVLAISSPTPLVFAQKLSTCIEQARQMHLFNHFIAIAPGRVLDALAGNLSNCAREALMLEMEADLVDDDTGVIRSVLPI